jgi:cyclophilin family peptidyl-prolyl cis-trans isomerase
VVQGGRFYPLPVGATIVPEVPALHDEPFNNPVLKNEFVGTKNLRGTLAMAFRDGNVDSATSEWLVNLKDNSSTLDAKHNVVFGQILGDGMDVVDAIDSLQKYDFQDYPNQPFGWLPLLPTYTVQEYINSKIPEPADWVTFSVRVVPEPVSMAMALSGTAIIGGAVWRRRRKA